MSKENLPKNLDSPELYINRELSWISFHTRVFEEARDLSHPLLERIKFMAICGSNFDEFFMVRIAGLKHQVTEGVRNRPPDGMTPTQQLDACLTVAHEIVKEEVSYWNNTLLPALHDSGIIIHRMNELESWQQESLRSYFRTTILPTLTPLAYDAARPFPFISNLGLNLFVIVTDAGNAEYYARIKLPVEFFGRFISVPWNEHEFSRDSHLVLLEDLVGTFLDEIFFGYNIRNYYPFRLTRDSGVTYAVDDGEDLLTAVEEGVASRRTGNPVRLEIDAGTSPAILNLLQNKFRLPSDAVFLIDGPIGMVDLWGLLKIDRPDLKDVPFGFCIPKIFEKPEHIFETLRKNDVMLYHPYDSFMPVIDFIRQAPHDLRRAIGGPFSAMRELC